MTCLPLLLHFQEGLHCCHFAHTHTQSDLNPPDNRDDDPEQSNRLHRFLFVLDLPHLHTASSTLLATGAGRLFNSPSLPRSARHTHTLLPAKPVKAPNRGHLGQPGCVEPKRWSFPATARDTDRFWQKSTQTHETKTEKMGFVFPFCSF